MATVGTLAGAYREFDSKWLKGEFWAGNTVKRIWYWNWPGAYNVDNGVEYLSQFFADNPAPYIIAGHGLGAQIAYKWIRDRHDVDPADITFYLTGNPERKYNGDPKGGAYPGWKVHPPGRDSEHDPGGSGIPIDTPYHVYDIVRQWDGWADVPDDQGNSIAITNMKYGQSDAYHYAYSDIAYDDPHNFTFVEGNVTYIWIPSLLLPMVSLEYTDPGEREAQMSQYRGIVESAYNRPCGAVTYPNLDPVPIPIDPDDFVTVDDPEFYWDKRVYDPGRTPAIVEPAPTHTVLLVPGTFGKPSQMTLMLQGQVTKNVATREVFYPNLGANYATDIPAGALALNNALLATTGQKTVFAHSLGAVVASYWLVHYGPSSLIPIHDLDFILIGNSVRKYNGYYPLHDFVVGHGLGNDVVADGTHVPTLDITDTDYTVTDLALQYDGWADWPDLVDTGYPADLAAFGTYTWHLLYAWMPLDRSDYRKHTEGNIEYVFMPNPGGTSSRAEVGYNRVTGPL